MFRRGCVKSDGNLADSEIHKGEWQILARKPEFVIKILFKTAKINKPYEISARYAGIGDITLEIIASIDDINFKFIIK